MTTKMKMEVVNAAVCAGTGALVGAGTGTLVGEKHDSEAAVKSVLSGQSMQLAEPAVGWYFPEAQSTQLVASVAD